MEYSKKTMKRIMKEIKILEMAREDLEKNGIYFFYDGSKLGTFYFLIVGIEGTPYEKGIYPFKMDIPLAFPFEPPKMKIILPNDGHSRMNPNLYVNGKVCLSMINTWSGPGWLPSFTLEKVMVVTQALVMHEHPLVNEPGHENDSKSKLNEYNECVLHQNYALAVIRMHQSRNDFGFKLFGDIINKLILENKDFYIEKLEEYVKVKTKKVFQEWTYHMRFNNKYKSMLEYVKNLE